MVSFGDFLRLISLLPESCFNSKDIMQEFTTNQVGI